jgi:peptidoglycan hydrolase-like protein with peptidoglycan-binding domain
MVQANEIGWGSYRDWEGPFYMGKVGVKVHPASIPEQAVMVTAAAEGGHYDAWNGYDSCGWTSGAIQWCERGQFSVSDMLGEVAVRDVDILNDVYNHGNATGITFERGPTGKWRFKFKDSRGFVDNAFKQQQLFYRTGTGKKGTWTNDSKLYAKGWAAAISTVWQDPVAQAIQSEYTYARLPQFLTVTAKNFFNARPMNTVADAIYAAYVSFAVNNPTWASASLTKAIASMPNGTSWWTLPHLIHVLKHLTFSPQVAIYPHRYNAIRPVLEKLYHVELPDFAKELQVWKDTTGLPTKFTTKQLQQGLISLGYDLGPKGADGSYGKYTKDALFSFEQMNNVPAEFQDGMIDVHTYPVLEKALAENGLSFPEP